MRGPEEGNSKSLPDRLALRFSHVEKEQGEHPPWTTQQHNHGLLQPFSATQRCPAVFRRHHDLEVFSCRGAVLGRLQTYDPPYDRKPATKNQSAGHSACESRRSCTREHPTEGNVSDSQSAHSAHHDLMLFYPHSTRSFNITRVREVSGSTYVAPLAGHACCVLGTRNTHTDIGNAFVPCAWRMFCLGEAVRRSRRRRFVLQRIRLHLYAQLSELWRKDQNHRHPRFY